jgi:hypothetical protein
MAVAISRGWIRALTALVGWLILAGTSGPVFAQPPAGAQANLESAVTELRQLLDEQRKLLRDQAVMIESQGRDIETLRRRLDAAGPPALAAATQAAPQAPRTEPNPEMPAQVVAGDFPRSIAVPGTDAAIRLGGQTRLMMVHSFGPLGSDDRFITSSIPVEGQQRSGEDERVNYSAAASRFNIDLRSTARKGHRAFIESDFDGPNGTLRLRHAYMQTTRWLGGQTWSTFSDPEAEPIGIDFEGLNAISLFRQPQLRYTLPFRETFDLALSAENPAPDLTGANGVNTTPDFIARVRWDPERRPTLLSRTAHVQAAILVRSLRGEVDGHPEATLSTGGFGMNVSGVLVPRWDADDRIKFASNNGWGIGRYIGDLRSLGGQDGVYDPIEQSLRSLPVSSAYAGYERMWHPNFTTTFTYGVVNVSNLDIQTPDSLKRTQRSTINLTWSPFAETSLIAEFLAGTRVNKDGQSGRSRQMQVGWLFRF